MKKFFDKKIIAVALLGSCIGYASASDFLVISRDVTGDGNLDQIKLTDNDTELYTLSVSSGGRELLRNEALVPKAIKNSGGLEVFQGLDVADGNISIRYRFCSPSSSVCYLRNVVSIFKDGKFSVSREEVVANADKIALTGIFYWKPTVPLESLTYQSLIENNVSATKLFAGTYGSCVIEMGGDSLMKISEELEKDSPSDWILKDGCITPALVSALQAQKYLSPKAASSYLSKSGAISSF